MCLRLSVRTVTLYDPPWYHRESLHNQISFHRRVQIMQQKADERLQRCAVQRGTFHLQEAPNSRTSNRYNVVVVVLSQASFLARYGLNGTTRWLVCWRSFHTPNESPITEQALFARSLVK